MDRMSARHVTEWKSVESCDSHIGPSPLLEHARPVWQCPRRLFRAKHCANLGDVATSYLAAKFDVALIWRC